MNPHDKEQTAELQALLVSGTPLIDVRAPVEFAEGSFPSASNLPILEDEERQQVGICYKHEGPDQAVKLGHELVSGEVRARRLETWINFLQAHPDAQLYCFRGGQRSQIACEWLKAAGYDVPRVQGGYKALRRALLAVYQDLPELLLVSGRTGSGKTLFLQHFPQALDLEGIARHRGSAFGGLLTPQPSQIDFENTVAIRFLQLSKQAPVMLEDEGRLIGRIHVPPELQAAMKTAPLLVIEDDVETRARRILKEYIDEQSADYFDQWGDAGLDRFESYLTDAVDAIRKRLGGVAHAEVRNKIDIAMQAQRSRGETAMHLDWIRQLLTDYYDPMYDYQLKSKSDRILARGSHEAVLDWVRSNREYNHAG